MERLTMRDLLTLAGWLAAFVLLLEWRAMRRTLRA
jgi:hypothetical protein